ncbi:AAA family ATPase [Parabacteroides segnis]|uniref:AAA family ATPase n=1 Tax=Parabacteroides segnis TaxID=2763058 RepID=UPI0035166610
MRSYKIPYAVMNYAQLREDGYYYVDKSRYITELEKYQVPVFLRPRRFGKSLFCTMLDYYYDLNETDRFESLFGDTWIGQHPTGRQNSYMVLHLDFSIVSVAENVRDMEKNFGIAMNKSIRGFAEITYKKYFSDFRFSETTNSADLLSDLVTYISLNDLPQMYIIIDEYDNFTNQLITSNKDLLYSELTTGDSFLRTFFKVIKEGVKTLGIGGVFITGVLPITMDDLTSGFNIAQMVTLQPAFVNMLGFTYEETEAYLLAIFDGYGFDKSLLPEIRQIIRNNYDGYRFLPGAEPIYNSTILTYFLNDFTINNGTIPDELIDENLRTDLGWIKRLTLGEVRAKEMLHQLVYEGRLGYTREMLKSKFTREQFFRKEFYPISLYYLGMTTLADNFNMVLPNNTMRTIFVDYYNTLNDLRGTADKYIGFFEQFTKDHSVETLFAGYYRVYLGQFPAQSFDKMNENFIRNTFYELCNRYLSSEYLFALEQNYPSGRADWEITGRPGTPYHKNKQIIEFKYFPSKDAKHILALEVPHPEDVEQVCRYAADAKELLPDFHIRQFVIYVVANKGYKIWEV